MSLPVQTQTPSTLLPLPSKSALLKQFLHSPLSALRTPALIVDRSVFSANCHRVTSEIHKRGCRFRAHVKTHKTLEGTRIQVEQGVKAVIASTLPEVWGVVDSGLVQEGLVDDVSVCGRLWLGRAARESHWAHDADPLLDARLGR